MRRRGIFVAGIGTEVGKTVVAATLVQALGCDYWKPIQSGTTEGTDSGTISSLAPRVTKIHPEAWRLKAPLSPHAAARLEGVSIDIGTIVLPESEGVLIVEGSGGLMVPLTLNVTVLDLIKKFELPVLLVSRHYLGSINHTLLSITALRQQQIPFLGLVYSGEENQDSERAIQGFSHAPVWGRIPELGEISQATIMDATRAIDRLVAHIREKV